LIRARYVQILFYKELLRFLANPALWILLLLFFSLGLLISVSDVILQRDAFNIVVKRGDTSAFLDFVDREDPDISIYTPEEFRDQTGLSRVVHLEILSQTFDKELHSGGTPVLEIASAELSQSELVRLRDLLIKNALLFVAEKVPLDIKIAAPSGLTASAGPEAGIENIQAPEDFKRLIMALLITISLNIITFNLFTVSFAEEKQNNTLLAILLSPARSSEIAVAKCLFFLIPGLALAAALTGVYRPDILLQPVFWVTLISGALLYMSMSLILLSYVERQATASLICLGYLFFLTAMFILAPRFTALYPIKNHLPENFIFSILSFLFDGTPFSNYSGFFRRFVTVSLLAPFVAIGIFSHRTSCKPPVKKDSPPRWTLSDCGFILAFCLVFHIFLTPALISLIRGLPVLVRHRAIGILLIYLGLFAVPLALILPVYTRLKFKQSLYVIFFKSPAPLRDILSGSLWFLFYVSGIMAATWIFFTACMPEVPKDSLALLEQLSPERLSFLRTILLMLKNVGPGSGLVFILLVPILEEAYFRGCLLNALQTRWGPGIALAGSSLAFGLLHFNLLLVPVYVLLGILTGLLYQRSRNLLAPVAFHSLNNLTSLAVISALF